jgi:hypothetical protein
MVAFPLDKEQKQLAFPLPFLLQFREKASPHAQTELTVAPTSTETGDGNRPPTRDDADDEDTVLKDDPDHLTNTLVLRDSNSEEDSE